MHRVVVIDDHRVFAELLSMALTAEPDFECVGHAQSVPEGVALVADTAPDIVLMDVRLGDHDGIAATAELTAADRDLRVVVLTAYVDRGLLQRAGAAHACALLPKDGNLAEMLQVLRTAHRGGFTVHPELLRRLVVPAEVPEQRFPELTNREREVLQMLASGLEARVIARQIGISLSTCRGYIRSVLGKVGAHSQLEAVAIAMRHGLISLEGSTARGPGSQR